MRLNEQERQAILGAIGAQDPHGVSGSWPAVCPHCCGRRNPAVNQDKLLLLRDELDNPDKAETYLAASLGRSENLLS